MYYFESMFFLTHEYLMNFENSSSVGFSEHFRSNANIFPINEKSCQMVRYDKT